MTPTVAQAESWRPEALVEVADGWSGAARHLREYADDVSRRDTSIWVGAAADAGWAKLEESRKAATHLASMLSAAADAAQHGAARIAQCRAEVLALVAAIRDSGYLVADDGTVSSVAVDPETVTRAKALTVNVRASLERLGAADADTAAKISDAFASTGSGGAHPAQTGPAAADMVAAWPSMAQDRIADQIAALSPEERRHLIETAPRQVGNTDGVPWQMRVAANRLNIAEAIAEQRRILERPVEHKIRDALAHGFGRRVDPFAAERLWVAVHADPALRNGAIAYHDRDTRRRIAFYEGLLAPITDPTGRSSRTVDRQILAFDPARSSLVELNGDLRSATSLGVLVPGLNTTIMDSAANTKTARRYVAAGRGDVAMITYLGGPFPTGVDPVDGLLNAANPRYALEMAPRLVAFSEDVNRTVDGTGRHIPVTYLGHSYGGSILGTAERFGLTADRTVYVDAAGAGVGVQDSDDWNNRNPDVERFAMTAPGDPIAWVQGLPGGPHGADPDELPGVWQLPTGKRLDGTEMSGLPAHSDVLNEPADAWRSILAVITGDYAAIK